MDDDMNNSSPHEFSAPNSIVRDIERRTKRAITIETAHTNRALARCNLQDQSSLFTLLPREIRDLIWQYATAPFEDESHQYEETEYYYRPGHTARLKTDINLVLTCRRIWLEANAFPMLQAEHCFWYYRAAPDCRNSTWMTELTDLNRENFGQLHLFAQMFAIEHLDSKLGTVRKLFMESTTQENDFQPRMLHVTIRHTDWWFWESDQPLRFRDSWLQALLDSPDLRSTHTLKLELETLDYKVNQLLNIVSRLENLESKEYETHIVDGKEVNTRFSLSGKEVQNWSGPININGENFRPYRGMERLSYHIITLTWKLKFPQLPYAHVPTLRRAPRISRTRGQEAAPHEDTNDETSYSPDFKTNSSYFVRPLRNRDYKKIRAGLWPARKSLWLEMLDAGLHVRMKSVHEAKLYENLRQGQFNETMALYYSEEWKRKWYEDGSLLHYAD